MTAASPRLPRWKLTGLACLAVLAASVLGHAQEAVELEVTAPSLEVRSGSTLLGKVSKASRHRVLKTNGPWYQIEIEVEGLKRAGWIPKDGVKVVNRTLKAARPQPATHLHVTAERADVNSGKTVLGQVRRGEVYPLKATQGPWHQIEIPVDGSPVAGWVAASSVRTVPASFGGPSLSGWQPASITAAKVAVDWKTEEVIVEAAPPIAGGAALKLVAPESSEGGSTLDVSVSEGTVRVKGKAASLFAFLAPGTRSLWLAEGEEAPRHHRLDLSPVDLQPAVGVTKFPNFAEGLVLTLSVEGLLPGFVVDYARQDPGDLLADFSPIERKKDFTPRLADVTRDASGARDQVRIIVPYVSDPQATSTLLLRIRNGDGSQSRTISLARTGDGINQPGTVHAEPEPALADAAVRVPSVELMTVEDAAVALLEAGLVPRVVEGRSLRTRPVKSVPDSLVDRQGIESGLLVLAGDTVLLSVQEDGHLSQVTDSGGVMLLGLRGKAAASAGPPTRVAVQGMGSVAGKNTSPVSERVAGTDEQPSAELAVLTEEDRLENPNRIDAGDDLGFVGVEESGLLAGGLGSAGAATPDGGLTSPEIAVDDSNLGELTGGLIGSRDPGLADPPAGMDSPPPLILPINPDPGVFLCPHQDRERAILRALLRLLLHAILRQPDPADLPGPIGEAISESVVTHELALLACLTAAAPQPMVPVEAVLDLLLKKLHVTLTEAQRAELMARWSAHAQYRRCRCSLDRNRNGRIGDDVVIFFLSELVLSKLYNPATQAILSCDAGCRPVLVLCSASQSPEWIKGVCPLVLPGQSVLSKSQLTVPGLPQGTLPGALANLPQGPPVVASANGPDTVRIPEVADVLVSTVHQQFRDIGLSIENAAELFQSDQAKSATPPQLTWVPSGKRIALQFHRQVPNLLKLSLKQAESELDRRKLPIATAGTTAPDDIVTRQEPAGSAFIPIEQPVSVGVSVAVPAVVGDLLENATKLIAKRDLKWSAATKTFKVDKVVTQKPSAGTLVEHGLEMKIEVHVPVPDVSGLTLAQARSSIEQWDLQPKVLNQFALEGDRVRGQSPEARLYVPHESQIQLGPVLGIVPDLRGKTVKEASAALVNDEKYTAELLGKLVGTDVVTMQRPDAGTEHERGQAVVLDARVRVPGVIRETVTSARSIIGEADGGLKAVVDGRAARTDLVYSQTPAANALVFPRTDVVIVPGVVVPRLAGMTPNQADALLRRVTLKGQIRTSSTRETTDRAEVGRTSIEGQDPRPGFYRRADVDLVSLSAVTLILKRVSVPNVVGDDQATAVAKIHAAGLEASVANAGLKENAEIKITVSGQDPPGGTVVEIGAAVNLTLKAAVVDKPKPDDPAVENPEVLPIKPVRPVRPLRPKLPAPPNNNLK